MYKDYEEYIFSKFLFIQKQKKSQMTIITNVFNSSQCLQGGKERMLIEFTSKLVLEINFIKNGFSPVKH